MVACAGSEALCSYKEHSELSLLATLSCILYSATALQCCSCTQCWPITYCCCRASTYLGYSTICTTRCGFVNVVFGFAARKASRHQLHKHVSAHVYLGVLAYYAKQRPSRCGSHMIMSMNRLRGTLSYSQIWEVQIGSCESRISCYSGSGSTYSRLHLFRVR